MNGFSFLVVGLGAALGAWVRWGLSILLNTYCSGLPLGTLFANLLGGYGIGLALAIFDQYIDVPPVLKLLIVTGVLGGLTTFSSFSAEVMVRLLAHQWGWALLIVLSHVLGSLLMTYLGLITLNGKAVGF